MTEPKVEAPLELRIDPEPVLAILQAFIQQEVLRTGLERAVLGLSGGLDSAVAAAVTVRALGPERTTLAVIPHEVSPAAGVEDARQVAAVLGVTPQEITITEMTRGYPEFDSLDRLRAGNLMARMRMAVLYDISAAERALVIGTSNKTELLLGYGTIFGDLASAVNPIGDLYKTQVRQLAPMLGIPEQVRRKAPSADLWRGQTDEEDLGVDYTTADTILFQLIDRRRSVPEVAALGFEPALVERLWGMIRSSEFKRHLPIICKLSDRTIGIDWLYPRDWGT